MNNEDERVDAFRVDGRVVRARNLRERRRKEIVNAACRVFAARGYHNGSIAEIIHEADVARGTFYLYFESKRAIFEEILDALLEQLRASVQGVVLGTSISPREQLLGNVQRVLEIFFLQRELTIILLHQATGLDEAFDARLTAFYASILAIIRQSLVQGMAMGLVRELDPDWTAHFIMGSLKEAIGSILKEPNLTLLDLEQLALAILDYNLLGTVPPAPRST